MNNTSNLYDFAAQVSIKTGRTECISHSLYDSITITQRTRVTRCDFFRFPVGSGKSFDETNMYMSSQLPFPQAFYVNDIAIGAEPYPREIMTKAIVEFVIGSKSYFHFAPAAALYRMPEGLKYGFRIDPGLGISDGINFSAALIWPGGIYFNRPLRPVTFRFHLNGWLFRPVQ